MKVFPEYFIQLSHRVNTLHKKRKSLLRAQVKRDKGNIVNPGQKTGSIFSYVY